MLGQLECPAAQVRQIRQDFDDLAAGWRMISQASAPSARAAAEVQIFNQMVVALEGRLASRLREAGDGHGHAMAELRLLAQGVRAHGAVFPGDNLARWRPDASVTGYRPGDRIALTEEVFSRLADVLLEGVAKSVTA
jgi:hypothetical protein